MKSKDGAIGREAQERLLPQKLSRRELLRFAGSVGASIAGASLIAPAAALAATAASESMGHAALVEDGIGVIRARVGASSPPGRAYPNSLAGDLTQRVLNTEPAALVGWWLLDGANGATIVDLSPNGCNGTAYNVVFGQQGPGDGLPSLGFDGSTSYIDLFSPTLTSLWNGDRGTFIYRAQIYNATQWNNTKSRRVIWAGHDDVNHMSIRKENYNNTFRSARETTGAQELFEYAAITTPGWFFGAHTWDLAAQTDATYLSLDQTTYVKTVRTGGLKSMQSPLVAFRIGNRPTTWYPSPENWLGCLARVGYWSVALTESEVAALIPIV